MGFVVLHMQKAHGTDAGTTAHIERTIMPSNADPSRTHLNQKLVEYPDEVKNRTQAIQHRLDTAGLKRKIGNNQVRAIHINLSGSPEDMGLIQSEGRLKEWCADNIKWLCDTFGRKNIVSADLHMDETTPHIHATLVPIVTGERRKAKAEQEKTAGKKKYKKKNPNAARLCTDDVMTRDKLKSYQDTYAEAMAKYGLQRGIDGSEARHTTTQEYYRELVVQNRNLQENVESLREQQTDAKQELSKVLAEVSREKFKNTAAEVGSNLIEGIGSVIGTSKVKRQQQEIDNLKAENRDLKQEITELNQTINRKQKDNEKATVELKAEHVTVTDKLRDELKKIYDLFPHIRELLRIENLCRHLRFSDELIKMILEMKPVGFKGKIYSAEYKRDFETSHSIAEVKPTTADPDKLKLTIDGVSDTNWFRQKYKEFQKSIGINIEQKQMKGRGIG